MTRVREAIATERSKLKIVCRPDAGAAVERVAQHRAGAMQTRLHHVSTDVETGRRFLPTEPLQLAEQEHHVIGLRERAPSAPVCCIRSAATARFRGREPALLARASLDERSVPLPTGPGVIEALAAL